MFISSGKIIFTLQFSRNTLKDLYDHLTLPLYSLFFRNLGFSSLICVNLWSIIFLWEAVQTKIKTKWRKCPFYLEICLTLFEFLQFLAAMSSSRSDVVTKFVRPCVRLFVCPSVPFFSISVLEVSSRPKEFQWCFKTV